MPKQERMLKFKEVAAGTVTRSAVHGGPSMDHGSMSGLGDDDHPQYIKGASAWASARVYNSAAIEADNDTWEALTFDSERWDTDTIHSTSTNTGRLTCVTAGIYNIVGHVSFTANVAGNRGMGIRLNATTYIATIMGLGAFAVQNTNGSISTFYQLAVGDYVELMVFQNSGAGLDVRADGNHTPEFGMIRQGA